jgi:hypothetical protein
MIGNPPIKPEMGVEKIFVISTIHARPSQINPEWGKTLPFFICEDEFMALFYVPEMDIIEDGKTDHAMKVLKQDYFLDVLRMASKLGCTLLKFDHDGYVIEGLQTFEEEWDDAEE